MFSYNIQASPYLAQVLTSRSDKCGVPTLFPVINSIFYSVELSGVILKESCSGFGLKDGRFAFIAPLDVPAAACPHACAAVRNYICSAKTDVNFNLSVLNVWR